MCILGSKLITIKWLRINQLYIECISDWFRFKFTEYFLSINIRISAFLFSSQPFTSSCPTTPHRPPCANKTNHPLDTWIKMNSSTIDMCQSLKTTHLAMISIRLWLLPVTYPLTDKLLSNRNKLLIWKEKLTLFSCIIKNSSPKRNDIGSFIKMLEPILPIEHFTPILLALSVNNTNLSSKNSENNSISQPKHTNKSSSTHTSPAKSLKTKSKPFQR